MLNGTLSFRLKGDFESILVQTGISLLVSTHNSSGIVVVGSDNGSVRCRFKEFHLPMAVKAVKDELLIATKNEIRYFRWNEHPFQECDGESYDGCYVPRFTVSTGCIEVHEISISDGEVWICNTRFSCLCTLHPNYSFVPQWYPSFVEKLDAGDQCHLNGMAIKDGKPAYATAFAQSSGHEAWRSKYKDGGVLIDVKKNAVVCGGLCMPHSPRICGNAIWLLDSGRGRFGFLNLAESKFEPVFTSKGFMRGLAFCGQFAFIGTSSLRSNLAFPDCPIDATAKAIKPGIIVVDIISGKKVGKLEFEQGVDELFSVEICERSKNPSIYTGNHQGKIDIWHVPSSSKAA